jgi:hypothetical protein
VDFYRARGYEVREGVRVRGASGNVYALDLVAEGPLGALLVSFGDAAGVDGAEVGRVRTLARDIGATPVIASPTASSELRRAAAQMAVVVLDEASLDEPAVAAPAPGLAPPPLEGDLAAHPWPASGRAGPAEDPAGDRLMEVDQVLDKLDSPMSTPWAASILPASPAPRAPEPVVAAASDTPAPLQPKAKFAWLDPAAATPAGPAVPAQPIEHEGTVSTRDRTLVEKAGGTIRLGRLAAYVAGGMLLLYLLVRFFSP